MTKTKRQVKRIQRIVRQRRNEQKPKYKYIPTGSFLLDLACSDNPKGGFIAGSIVNIIGDKSAGKSILCATTLAECAHRREFDDYRLIYDDVENAFFFDTNKLFGKKMTKRMEMPSQDIEGNPRPSKSLEEFYSNVIKALDKKRPFIYVCDSLDALHTIEDEERAKALIKSIETGKEMKGSYKTEKPKMLSEMLRNIMNRIKETQSLLVIISQTRQNLDPFSFEKKRRSGGDALGFYSVHEIWLTKAGQIKDNKTRFIIGNKVAVKFTKNKPTGKIRNNVEFDVYYDYGIDNIGSCINFLVQYAPNWKKKAGGIIDAGGITSGRRKDVIEYIEEQNLEKQLMIQTYKTWKQIEENLSLERKKRYE